MSFANELDRTEEYSRRLTVPVYDVGPGDTLKPGSAFRLAQETSEQHVGLLGVGYEALKQRTGLVFFMVEARLRVRRFPKHGEELRISTRPRGQSRAEYYRDFRFFGAGDEPLLSIMQVTVLADSETHRVKRIRGLEGFGPNAVKAVEPEDLVEKILLPEQLPRLGTRKIFRSDLDANGHMNNAVYCDILWDFLPEAARGAAGEIRISYRGETPEGAELRISGGESGGEYYLRGDSAAGMSFTASISPFSAENP